MVPDKALADVVLVCPEISPRPASVTDECVYVMELARAIATLWTSPPRILHRYAGGSEEEDSDEWVYAGGSCLRKEAIGLHAE